MHVNNVYLFGLNNTFNLFILLSFTALLGSCADIEPGHGTAEWTGDETAEGHSVPGETDESSGSTVDGSGDSSSPDSSSDAPSGPPPCAEIEAEAANLYLPVDIIWAIDSSGSMSGEIELIQERMNGFVEYMETTGIDYRLILLAGEAEQNVTSYDVCIPPPLSSVDSCPDEDGPRYRHVKTHVDSFNALEQLVDHYHGYSDFLRPQAAVHMVVVSDDESDMSAANFLTTLRSLGHQPFTDNLTFHSVVSDAQETCILGFCWDSGCSGPYGDASAPGDEYVTLSEETGGIFSNICSAEWDPIFESMADSVLASTRIPCAFALPQTPEGLVVDYESVEISFENEDGTVVDLHRVFSENECGPGKWHYDDHSSPGYIQICSDSCGEIFGSLQITIGCEKG